MLSQFVCSHSTSKYLTAWIWSSKKYHSVKPLELPVFAYRHKERVQLFGDVFWFTNISRSVRECRESELFFRKIRETSSEFRESSLELKASSLELKESSSELKESSSELKESSSELKESIKKDLRSFQKVPSTERGFQIYFKRGFEKESALLIPTTPLKAMDENCDTITDQTLCIQGVN